MKNNFEAMDPTAVVIDARKRQIEMAKENPGLWAKTEADMLRGMAENGKKEEGAILGAFAEVFARNTQLVIDDLVAEGVKIPDQEKGELKAAIERIIGKFDIEKVFGKWEDASVTVPEERK